CSSDSPGYAYNEKKCCKANETVVDGYCCPAGSTHYAKDVNDKYICCDDAHYAAAGTWISGPKYDENDVKISDGVFTTSPTCTDGTDRWVVISECSKLKISCPATSKRACGTDCCDEDEKYCNYDWVTGFYYCCKNPHDEFTECASNN
ncbi:MAG: hypothetical protein ACI4OR_00660, partial [Alphaproteobacteria bacterium]